MNRISIIKNGFWTTYGAIVNRLLALLSNLLLARLLLPSDFGVISVTYIFWSFINLFVQGTTGDFLVYKGLEDRRYIDTTYSLSICIGIVGAAAMIALSPLAANFFDIPDLIGLLTFFAFNFFLSSVQAVYAGIMRRRMQYQELANAALISSMIRIFATAGCALAGLSYWSFAIGDTIFWLTIFWITAYYTKFNFYLKIDPQIRSEALSYCIGSVGSSLGFYINSNSDNFVIGRLLGTTNLGYYNFAYQVTTAFSLIMSQIMNQLGISVFAQMKDERQQEDALVKVVEQMSYFAALLFAVIYLIVDETFISYVFGEKFIPSVRVIPWLLIFAYFRLINTSLSSMLAAKGRPDINAKVNLQIAPLAVISFLIGAWQGGILGVAIAVVLILGFVWTIFWWWSACKVFGWSIFKYLTPCLQALFMAIFTLVTIIILPISKLISPIVYIVLYLLLIRMLIPNKFFAYLSLIKKLAHKVKLFIHR
ncbi:oligosaccharide flippase family protein [Tolypothrix sp. FACHB-123]|uniref:oligosaccharide flippase family protein n=1 Tax=Tolypothrix sp. FACHB-123 TaxID=2692868 RepID=UPI0016890965|nr:oligosaccharide flippase family protein [Tolypothrix sp. FACHB-123]MBD2358953.1 oligosaccharide flippase family protein [Tolypothrix sp. FACHB-123]